MQKINVLMQQASPSSSSPSSQALTSPSLPSHPPNQHQEVVLEGTKIYNAFGQLLAFLENSAQVKDRRCPVCFASTTILTYMVDDAMRKSLQHVTVLLNTSPTVPTLLQPISKVLETRSREEEEIVRLCGKVDRGLEKARRIALKLLEADALVSAKSGSSTEFATELRVFLLQCVESLGSFPSLPVRIFLMQETCTFNQFS